MIAMQAVRTRLTQLLGIRVPIVCAPMAFGTNAQTAVEVTRCGGFGFVGAGYRTPASVKQDFALIRNSFPDLGLNEQLPVGYGFICWQLDKNQDEGKQLIDIVIENGVRAIWLAFGNDIYRWVEYIRTSPANTRAPHKPLIFIQATSVEEALTAANEWKVDVIVAEGTEAGGHGGAVTPSTFVLVSEVLAMLAHDGAPPVLAAGGMATGTQIAAYLGLGAAGAVLGTRFLLTPESPYKPEQKAALLAVPRGAPGATVRTLAFDLARDTAYWPAHINGRGLRNAIVDDIEAGVDLGIVQSRFREAVEAGDASYMVVFAGQGVTLMNEIKPIKDVMGELHTDLVRQLQKSQRLLQEP